MARTVMLVFAVITLVFGAVLMTGWTFILMMDISLKEQFPGATMNPESIISFYLLLSFGILLLAVSIFLFILRARRKD